MSEQEFPDPLDDLPEDLPKESPRDSLPPPRNRAMNWLARREHSRAELAQKLASREYPQEEIEAALDGLAADGLLCDERFAESFIAARMRKGQGPVRIRMELKKRGVDSDTIHLCLEESDRDWLGLAREVRDKKFGGSVPGDFTEKARQMRFLEYRGFTGEQIRAALGDD